MSLTDQEAYVRGLKTSLQEAHRWRARSPSPPRGQRGSPAPDTHQAKKTKGHRHQGARQRAPAGRDAPTKARVQPHRTAPRPTPGAQQQHHHHQRPSPPRTLHPNPAAQSATTAHTRPHHARTTVRAEPGDMAPPTPPPRPRPSQPLPPNAPKLQRPPPATSPPRPSTTRPREPPTPHSAHHRTTPSRYHHHQPLMTCSRGGPATGRCGDTHR